MQCAELGWGGCRCVVVAGLLRAGQLAVWEGGGAVCLSAARLSL